MPESISIINKQKKLVKFSYINHKKIIVFHLKKKNYYLEVDKKYNATKLSKVELGLSTRYLRRGVFSSFVRIARSFTFLKRKILFLRGLGMKVFLKRSFRTLFFKLGFSHPYNVFIKNEIFLRLKKNFISLQSFNREVLGNFARKLKNLRTPDSYKGKGIWYKNEKIKLKPVKKK